MNKALLLCAVLGTAIGCGASKGSGDGSAFTTTSPADPAPAGGDPSGTFANDQVDASPPDAGPPKIIFYANTDTTLYQLDPDDLSSPMTKIGDFDCVGTGAATSVMTDIAVDKHGKVFGVSPAAAWPLEIQNGVVHCAAKWPLEYGTHFNGLTFAPEGTVDVDEVLVGGNAAGDLYRIDAGTGLATKIGSLGTDPVTGLPWTISGDMVFLANGGDPIGFATVRTCSSPPTGCTTTDTLLEIDVKALGPSAPSVGKAVRGVVTRGSWCGNAASPSSFGSMFGVVALKDKAYGFSRRGDFVEMHTDTGSGCLVWSRSDLKFAGAGVTTIAPVTAPPPR